LDKTFLISSFVSVFNVVPTTPIITGLCLHKTNLVKSLQNKAVDDLKKKIASDKVLLPELINAKVENSTANKEVNDEAATLNLKGTVSYDGVVYAKSDLIFFAKALFKDKLTPNQIISDESVNVDVKNITNKNDELVADLNFGMG